MPIIKETQITIHSIYGLKSRLPIVSLAIQDTVTQMSPKKAREVALMLLECAEAAEVDAFIYEFTTKNLGAEETAGLSMINEFRKWREAHDADRPV